MTNAKVAESAEEADLASGAKPAVTVIVPHFSDLGGLALCLEALERQTYPRNDFEIIVGDNNSPEGADAVEAVIAGRARMVVTIEKGAGPARNGAVAVARGDILAFTDSDCQVEPEWLLEGLAALDEYDFVGGRVKVLVPDMRRLTAAEAFERVFAFNFETYILKQGFTGSGNLFCSRAVFDAVGGFRAVVSEDVDWSFRARALGYRLGYAPRAILGHPARRTWADLLTKWRKSDSEAFHLMSERPGGRWKWFFRSLALPASAIAHTPRVLASHELNTSRHRALALAALFRLRWWRFIHAMGLLVHRRR